MEEEKKRKAKISAIGQKTLDTLLPSYANSLIVAVQHTRKEEPYFSYGQYSVNRIVILGYSYLKKNSFKELHRAAANFEETQHLIPPTSYLEKKDRKLGVYLGQDYYDGWIVRRMERTSRESLIREFGYWAGQEENIRLHPVGN